MCFRMIDRLVLKTQGLQAPISLLIGGYISLEIRRFGLSHEDQRLQQTEHLPQALNHIDI